MRERDTFDGSDLERRLRYLAEQAQGALVQTRLPPEKRDYAPGGVDWDVWLLHILRSIDEEGNKLHDMGIRIGVKQ